MACEQSSDVLVVGGGIVGLATAWKISRRLPDARITLLEKEDRVAAHQSGRNSGVLHSGIYYKPGSLKATTCHAGKRAMEAFCHEQSVAFETCGKIIVAVDESELAGLERIHARGVENGVVSHWLDRRQILDLEPNAAGIRALHVPEAGIVDYPAVCKRLAELLVTAGHQVLLGQKVVGIESNPNQVKVQCSGQSYTTSYLVTCGGLHSDRLVRLSGLKPPAQIVPFRGEYFKLKESRRHLCRNLIYPVPDPNFPFLGVHFTRMIGGEVECGPNAVLALSREGYTWGTLRWTDLAESVTYRGFLRLASRHWRMGLGEIHRSLSKAAFVKALQRLMPEIRAEDLAPCRAGVRAQALAADGSMIDDFLWVDGPRMLHVCNAPSPAATASLEIGRIISDRVVQSMSISI
jgi:(S)-2-hydroxyglutarate dehydrogenase